MENKRNKKKGFTLIEMIVVMAIIAVLAGIAVPQVMKSIQKSKATSDIASARTLAGAIQQSLAEGSQIDDTTNWTKISDLNGTASGKVDFSKYIDNYGSGITPKINNQYVFYYFYNSTNNQLKIGAGKTNLGSGDKVFELYPNFESDYK